MVPRNGLRARSPECVFQAGEQPSMEMPLETGRTGPDAIFCKQTGVSFRSPALLHDDVVGYLSASAFNDRNATAGQRISSPKRTDHRRRKLPPRDHPANGEPSHVEAHRATWSPANFSAAAGTEIAGRSSPARRGASTLSLIRIAISYDTAGLQVARREPRRSHTPPASTFARCIAANNPRHPPPDRQAEAIHEARNRRPRVTRRFVGNSRTSRDNWPALRQEPLF